MVCVRLLAQSLVRSMQVVVAVITNSGGAECAPNLHPHFSEIPQINPQTTQKQCVSRQAPGPPPKQIATVKSLFYGHSGAIAD